MTHATLAAYYLNDNELITTVLLCTDVNLVTGYDTFVAFQRLAVPQLTLADANLPALAIVGVAFYPPSHAGVPTGPNGIPLASLVPGQLINWIGKPGNFGAVAGTYGPYICSTYGFLPASVLLALDALGDWYLIVDDPQGNTTALYVDMTFFYPVAYDATQLAPLATSATVDVTVATVTISGVVDVQSPASVLPPGGATTAPVPTAVVLPRTPAV